MPSASKWLRHLWLKLSYTWFEKRKFWLKNIARCGIRTRATILSSALKTDALDHSANLTLWEDQCSRNIQNQFVKWVPWGGIPFNNCFATFVLNLYFDYHMYNFHFDFWRLVTMTRTYYEYVTIECLLSSGYVLI